jgi:hypothetical protein
MKNKSLEFRTMGEFENYYFPRDYERKMIEGVNSKEYGIYLAQQTLKYIEKILI